MTWYALGSRRGSATMAMAGSLLLSAGCAPAARPLTGAPTRAVLPPSAIPTAPTVLRFTWSYKDETFEASGDGAVRRLGPDRARLDFFLRNGMAGGYAILVGDTLTIPGIDLVKRMLPPVPLLWASLGRLALPPTADTLARQDGDTLRADLGTLRGRDASGADGRAWRVAFAGTQLARVDRIEDGKVIEWMTRSVGQDGPLRLQYVHERGKRRLAIAVTDTTIVEGFDDAIWRRR
ncbi:hypothetical protein [Gemmatimonas phototrophica]|uniref:Outer-membrane lipoprotein LolB n=1 Tax=Gemmatimonas phototrophica TaxID=1379270 RepID=A0A143BIN0_9BACT|nr:hypothetical protein [Gemmatimonas phototrophica]AMW04869.1 hypothetical protein GEMMAAP_08515 [Gemmatimonas phototrophica]